MTMTYFDINNRAIRTGDLVVIRNAYNKSANGLHLVTRTPGDPSWNGRELSLLHITKAGIVSKGKYAVNDWPLHSYVTGWEKRRIADGWNAEHATIEIVPKTPEQRENTSRFFADAANIHQNIADDYCRRFGETSNLTEGESTLAAHLRAIADFITNEPTA